MAFNRKLSGALHGEPKESAPRRKWTIDVERTKEGFRYQFHGIGILGFEPTRARLAAIVAKTITEYLPEEERVKATIRATKRWTVIRYDDGSYELKRTDCGFSRRFEGDDVHGFLWHFGRDMLALSDRQFNSAADPYWDPGTR